WQTSSTSSADTERLGELLGSHLNGGEVIELRSDLGGGKTTFVRGLVRGAKIAGKVSSPSFTLSRIYKNDRLEIHHFDFYRLSEPGILRDQLAESLSNPKAVVIVEWPDIVKDVLPDGRLSIEINMVAASPDERQLIFHYPEVMRQIIIQLETQYQEVQQC
ncbi:tRNA (adenosine(37)-N6)-threonylcarbamoyltransferase complex ATPase subunit type 1 TsaE, partial [Candidatus Saccharibacteria bacterium]|nr:tRNA (adenosine(37)-N6)-threonylcarbamoyltransferase complex ATPase subunit type 1 TsaE [Candidatus Saccharibacteria bacterium]